MKARLLKDISSSNTLLVGPIFGLWKAIFLKARIPAYRLTPATRIVNFQLPQLFSFARCIKPDQ